MGGPGSGYPMWKARRPTADSSLALDVRRLSRDHSRFICESQSIRTWRDPDTQDPVASIGIRITSNRGCAPAVVLSYQTDRGQTARGVSSVVKLDKTSPFFGGVRWWFVCPSCKQRVAKLYFPFGYDRFLCRHCHGLTYQSCQDSHRFDKLFAVIAGDHGNDVRRTLIKRLTRGHEKGSYQKNSVADQDLGSDAFTDKQPGFKPRM